ncbi:MAG: hypothetical protein K2X27_03085 [Candidatus Obscuribacterales bacterium]|nr:hypothetical protein [Candidatus Obscuribacterales bacterium]
MLNDRARTSPYLTRSERAASFIEMAAGILVMIPIILLLVNLGGVLVAFMMNGDIAQKTARAAAAAGDGQSALLTAQTVVSQGSKGGMATIKLSCFKWQSPTSSLPNSSFGTLPKDVPGPGPGQVLVVTKLTVKLLAPMPGLPESQEFQGMSIQPIVGVGATLPK